MSEYGPNSEAVQSVIEQAKRLPKYNAEDRDQWVAARDARVAVRVAAREAAWVAAWQAARDARDAAWQAAWVAAWDAVWDAAGDAVWEASGDAAWDASWAADATVVRDLITDAQYQTLTAPWQVWVDTFGLDQEAPHE
jgi:hypothetical protein